jgi:TDG/mug DNA glycosylase family protein
VPLRDRIARDVRVLFVGINPGIRSALTGHHFAGYSNRFWKLLYDSQLVPEPIDWRHDARLPEWGYGITNLVARETRGIDTLSRAECEAGVVRLRAKVRRFKPPVIAFVGVSLFRWIFGAKGAVKLGLRRETFEGAEVFVLPNPSGRNANFTYTEMLAAFRALRRRLDAGR